MKPSRADLARFAKFCQFDAATGCVVWTGGKTRGRGKTAFYGAFWYEGKVWRAHCWAAEFIHDQPRPLGYQCDHWCPNVDHPNTLCIEHVQAVPAPINRELQWIRVQVGLDEPPPLYSEDVSALPFYPPPEWLKPFMETKETKDDFCPF